MTSFCNLGQEESPASHVVDTSASQRKKTDGSIHVFDRVTKLADWSEEDYLLGEFLPLFFILKVALLGPQTNLFLHDLMVALHGT